MNLLSLSIKLPRFFLLAQSPASLLFGRCDLFLDLYSNIGRSRLCGLRLFCIIASHHFRFPLTDPLAHKGRAVGFSHITTLDTQINDANITTIVIDLTFPIGRPTSQASPLIPVSPEGKA